MVQATTGKPVYVEWYDSQSASGWTFAHELQWSEDYMCPLIKSVGWIIFENKNVIIIAADDGDDQYGRRITIPKVAIASLYNLDLESFKR